VIQRIQSLYLIIAVLLIGGVFFTPLFDRLLEDPAAWILSAFVAATAFSAVISIWVITLFANRPAQIKWLAKVMIFQIIAIAMAVAVFFTLGNIGSNLIGEASAVAMLTLALVLQYLARQAIIKDEKLVKSIDRIR
jgi:hypothetical protein